MKKFLKSAVIVVSMMPFALATNSFADSKTFMKPKQGGNRLGRQAVIGQLADPDQRPV